ncbi:EG45-like domain containing protein [Linum perenne]
MATTSALVVFFISFGGLLLLSIRTCSGYKGTASFYTPPYEPSACYGYDKQDGMTAAASETHLWQGGRACGKHYRVKCISGTNQGVAVPCKKGKSVTVKIIDLCPAVGCKATIDLSQKAFAHIADPDEGIINISYDRYVISSPTLRLLLIYLVFFFFDGFPCHVI